MLESLLRVKSGVLLGNFSSKIVLLILLFAGPAFGWHTNTHIQMTRDAVSLMPPELKQTFVQNRKFVEAGISDPDQLLKDWQNHYYIPATSEGGALDRIDKLIKIIEIKLKSPNKSDASKQMCYLAHYIADLWTPQELIKADTGSDADFMKTNNLVVLFEGYSKPIENIRDYLQKRAEWRWRLENSKQISTLLYSEAVNDIALIWLTLWQRSGQSISAIDPMMLAHKQEILAVQSSSGSSLSLNNAWYDQSWSSSRYSTTRTVYEQVRLRNEQAQIAKLNPETPFTMLESSLRTIEGKSYFVARIQTTKEVPSIAFMYPGVRGTVAMLSNLSPGQVAKVEAVLPGGANKDQIQIIFSTLDE